MKTHLLFPIIGILLTSCSGTKEVASASPTHLDLSKNPYYIIKDKEQPAPRKVINGELSKKVNTIIADYLNVPINSIARSPIKETKQGYEWKFMNVKTGSSYNASSDFEFSSVIINKNTKVSGL